ncbi:MAG TPA: hypothetical protein VF812_10030 [Ktedonobacterales bacterium]
MDKTQDGQFTGQQDQSKEAHDIRRERHSERMTDRNRRQMRNSTRTRRRGRPDIPDSGIGDLWATLRVPLLDLETLSLEVHHTWHTLFPDGGEAIDKVFDEPIDEAVDEAEDGAW